PGFHPVQPLPRSRPRSTRTSIGPRTPHTTSTPLLCRATRKPPHRRACRDQIGSCTPHPSAAGATLLQQATAGHHQQPPVPLPDHQPRTSGQQPSPSGPMDSIAAKRGRETAHLVLPRPDPWHPDLPVGPPSEDHRPPHARSEPVASTPHPWPHNVPSRTPPRASPRASSRGRRL
uniref:Uncharacterized protein n=1 Tax=Triticum urartu TaxID=4572 RepID=A0A8R7U3M2_TRIUA